MTSCIFQRGGCAPRRAPAVTRNKTEVSWWQNRIRLKNGVRESRVRKVSSIGYQPATKPVTPSAKRSTAVSITAMPAAPNHGEAAARKYISEESVSTRSITARCPWRMTRYAVGIMQSPFRNGRNEVVSSESMSPAPRAPAKRMMIALSVSTTSPGKPKQDESTARRSAFRTFCGVSSAVI